MSNTTGKLGGFIPEVWSQEVMDKWKDDLIYGVKPKRSRGAQLLRDAALGKPEYPQEYPRDMTATEVRMRNEQYNNQLAGLRESYRHNYLNIRGSGYQATKSGK